MVKKHFLGGELLKQGKIQQSLSGFYDVISDGELYRTRARGNFRNKKVTPLVGDEVEFQLDDNDQGYILKVLPRKNELTRPPIANIDQAIVATAVVQPSFSSNLLDRQLIALEISKIKPVIYFTKTDLLSADELRYFQQLAEGYRRIGYQVILPETSFDEASLTEVQQILDGNETVIMGQTGAGKSTLLNHIAPELKLATGEISQALNRGKHTTRKVSLLKIGNGLIADTPGFSSYDPFELQANELAQYFPEFKRASKFCRFRGCVHVNEPDCEVKKEVEEELIMHSRYENYLQLYMDIKNRKPIYNKK